MSEIHTDLFGDLSPFDEAPTANGTAPDSAGDDRTVIKLSDGAWPSIVDQAAAVLDDRVYLRDRVAMVLTTADVAGGRRVAPDAVELGGVRYARGTPVLVQATSGFVAHLLDQRTNFKRFAKREKEWVDTRCPDPLARRIVDVACELSFRSCNGIVHVPLFDNGAVRSTNGWDEDSGLFIYAPELPAMATTPSRADAIEAVETILWPFRGYTTADRSALLAAALTAALRGSIPTAPGIVIDGNTQGVGKGKIARSLSALGSGHMPAVITEGHSEEETEKRITAAFLTGASVILLDNLQRHFASSAVESALTEGTATIRVFGKLENLRVPTRALILFTANNASFRRDMLRRTLPVRIVVPSEAPEKRAFDFDPVDEVQTNRHHMLAAAFTIARAWWAVRNEPDNRRHHRPLGSFEMWAELVGGAVAWLLDRNPVDLISERKEADPYVAAERAAINTLAEKFGDRGWRAADAIEAVPSTMWGELLSTKRTDDKPTAKAVGHWLRVRKDRVFGQWMLCAEQDRNGVNVWRLKVVAS